MHIAAENVYFKKYFNLQKGREAKGVMKSFIIVSLKLTKLMPSTGSVEDFMVN